MTRQSNFIRPSDWSTTEYKEAFRLADLILQKPEEFSHSCEGKVLASLFLSHLPGPAYLLKPPLIV